VEKMKRKIKRILETEILFMHLWWLLSLFGGLFILGFLYFRGIITIATVNNQRITLGEIIRFAKRDPQNAIDLAINDEIVAYEAKKRNVVVTTNEINDEIDRLSWVAARQGKTIAELYDDPDLKLEELQKRVKLQLTYYKILGEQPHITEEEIDQFLDESNIPYTPEQREFVEDNIRLILYHKKADAEYDTWIREARAESDIDYFFDPDNLIKY
jgi:cell division protein FtsI/penicillin-binding protein 2